MMVAHSSQHLAIDPSQSSGISANLSERERLDLAAQQFEAIFLQLVLKNMHSATEQLAGDDSLLQSREQKLMRDMHDAQLSQLMAQKRELGLADAIVKQLAEQISEVENKFKQQLEATALSPQESSFHSSASYHNSGFTQPLWSLPNE